jgi:hypothetical protein
VKQSECVYVLHSVSFDEQIKKKPEAPSSSKGFFSPSQKEILCPSPDTTLFPYWPRKTILPLSPCVYLMPLLPPPLSDCASSQRQAPLPLPPPLPPPLSRRPLAVPLHPRRATHPPPRPSCIQLAIQATDTCTRTLSSSKASQGEKHPTRPSPRTGECTRQLTELAQCIRNSIRQ